MKFVPDDFDASQWENIEPYVNDLLQRKLSCSSCLETLISDSSNLAEHISETGALFYIDMTCDTENDEKKNAFLNFVEHVRPKLSEFSDKLNRKIIDHLSDINFPVTEHARRYLLDEGIKPDTIIKSGSPMKEILDFHKADISKSNILNSLGLKKEKFFLVSAHREENIDSEENFIDLLESLDSIAETYKYPIIVSTHPRTKKKIEQLNLKVSPRIRFVEPLGFCDYVFLQKNALITLSDSGTISEESTMLGFKAVSIRTSTERPEAIDYGNIVLGDITTENIIFSSTIPMF